MTAQSPGRIVALVLLTLGLVFGGVAQLVPVSTFSTSFFGATADAKGYVWRATFHAEGFGESSSESKSWYDGDFDGEDGSKQVRAGGPLLAASCLLVLVGLVLMLRSPRVGGIIGIVGAVLAGIATWLLSDGMKSLFDGQQEWAIGLWFLIAAAVLALVGALVGVVAPAGRAEPASRPPGSP